MTDPLTQTLRVLSLGAGVQSSTLALMIAAGELEPIDCAIFADTQSEPRAVYDWLDYLQTKLPFPVKRVTQGSLRQNILNSVRSGRFAGAQGCCVGNAPANLRLSRSRRPYGEWSV